MEIFSITGPVESGKTYYLNSRLEKAVEEEKKVLGVECYLNDRSSPRDLNSDKYEIFNLGPKTASVFKKKAGAYDVIGFDEIQLYSANRTSRRLFSEVMKQVLVYGEDRLFYFAGLRDDFLQRPFPTTAGVLSISNKRFFLTSRNPCYYCGTTENVSYSVMVNDSEDASEGNIIVGDGIFKAACLKCVSERNFKTGKSSFKLMRF